VLLAADEKRPQPTFFWIGYRFLTIGILSTDQNPIRSSCVPSSDALCARRRHRREAGQEGNGSVGEADHDGSPVAYRVQVLEKSLALSTGRRDLGDRGFDQGSAEKGISVLPRHSPSPGENFATGRDTAPEIDHGAFVGAAAVEPSAGLKGSRILRTAIFQANMADRRIPIAGWPCENMLQMPKLSSQAFIPHAKSRRTFRRA
jgi:hypothetical protein